MTDQKSVRAVNLDEVAGQPAGGRPAGRSPPRIPRVASSSMADQSISEQAREAVLQAIIKTAPKIGNSPAGVRDLAEASALLERNLVPNAGIVKNKT